MSYQITKNIPKEIFRAYDVRGIVDESFTENNIYTVGVAIGSEALSLGVKTLAVGRDGRISGPVLLEALIAGIRVTGCNVINLGEVTTPIVYYKAALIDSRSGVVLSGSHNPPNYNGIKMVLNGETLYGNAIQRLYQRIVDRNYQFSNGMLVNEEVIGNYIQRIVSDVKLARPLKVVVDCGNGVGGKIAPNLIRRLGCEVHELFCDVDGNFPNHHPDPSEPKNLEDLVSQTQKLDADIGLAFDGDADRVGVVTNTGEIIVADRILMLFALDLLTRRPGETIIFDVKCSRNLINQIRKHGGIPLMYKTGHSLVKAKMKECGVLLAGEMSGHIFFKERWYGFDDGIYVAARLLELIARKTDSCDDIFAALPNSIITPEIKIFLSEDRKFNFMEEFKQKASFPSGRINLIDGVRVDYDHGFGLVRPSNTSPNLIMRFEGDTENDLLNIQNAFREELLKIDANLDLSDLLGSY